MEPEGLIVGKRFTEFVTMKKRGDRQRIWRGEIHKI